jgi:hypothetical protein
MILDHRPSILYWSPQGRQGEEQDVFRYRYNALGIDGYCGAFCGLRLRFDRSGRDLAAA